MMDDDEDKLIMNKYFTVTLLCIMAMLMIPVTISCTEQNESPVASPEEPYSGNHGIFTTKVTPQPGDEVTTITAQWPPLTLNDLVRESDAILIGEVVDILPARQTKDTREDDKTIIYTDVVVEVQRYLYGQLQSSYVAIRVKGGAYRQHDNGQYDRAGI
jgi:hypothetical protein